MCTLREIQKIELQMLKDVIKVCDEYNIDYFLCGGTLLGAVRHKGFIPWDDDIDISMTVKNYKKFLKIGQKALGPKYFVQNYRTEKNYTELWTQIRVNNTTSMPIDCKNHDIHWGICMDIFPIIGVSNDHKKREKQKRALAFSRTLLADSIMKIRGEYINKKLRCMYLIPRCIRRLFCVINEHKIMLDTDKYGTLTEVWYDFTKDYPAELFQSSVLLDFEDVKFKAMSGYDEFLKITYGDYLQLPPENERSGHDLELGKIIYDTERDYTYYK